MTLRCDYLFLVDKLHELIGYSQNVFSGVGFNRLSLSLWLQMLIVKLLVDSLLENANSKAEKFGAKFVPTLSLITHDYLLVCVCVSEHMGCLMGMRSPLTVPNVVNVGLVKS